ncbi:hypothetical protein H6787_02735 [Candidatus Nomurabacteria bacterium]|nr:hypothetical protein [Candidatus Nomurabacteria bacterium]
METLQKLYKVADQTRTIHSLLRDKLVFIETLVLVYVTVGSAISAMLIFAPISPSYEMWVGIFIASIFIVSLIPNAFDFKQKILERSLAVNAWGKWVRDAKSLCDNGGTSDEVKHISDQYKVVMDETPLIPDRVFNKYKQKHLQKVAISKALSETPFRSIREIKKSLKNDDLSK